MVSRLKRNHTIQAESMGIPMGILIKDIDKKIVNEDEIEDITYNSNIDREFTFEKSIDNPEWSLQQKK